MSPKRGDRVAPPRRADEYELRFGTNDAAKGWEELCRHAPGSTRTAFEAIRSCPRPVPANPRQHRLKGALAFGTQDGRQMERWQYEVTGGGRVWYLVDGAKRVVWVSYAGTGHPKATDAS
jgi:CubicO group peptidase (beta-lactamase class C family)